MESDGTLEATPADGSRPRLGIAHLLLITVCVAGFLSSSASLFGDRLGAWQIWYAVQDGLWLTGIILLLGTSIRGRRPVLSEPGHWLLITEGLFHVLGLPVQFLASALDAFLDTGVFWWFPSATTLVWIQAAVCVVAALASRSIAWRVFFLVQSTIVFLEAVTLTYVMLNVAFGMDVSIEDLAWINIVYRPVLLGTQISALVIPLCECILQGRRRDPIHWLGVTVYASYLVTFAIGYFSK